MQEVTILWNRWHGDTEHRLLFPRSWEVLVSNMEGAPAIKEKDIDEALNRPIGTKRLCEIAAGKQSVGIVMDDISRPTPGDLLLPKVISQLEKAGIKRSNISIFMGLGSHRPLTRKDMLCKLGSEILNTVQVFNHHPYQDLVSLGKSRMGTPITISRRFMETDLKIAIGSILPHSMAGFSGGAKAIVPGIAGIETMQANHINFFYEHNGDRCAHFYGGNLNNPLRQDMEDIVQKIGLDFIVNVVFNQYLQFAGIFCGDFIDAHREGVKLARKVYRTRLIEGADIIFLNCYPKDTEFILSSNAFTVLGEHPKRMFKNKNCTLILCSASPEGVGFHSLSGPGGPLFFPFDYNKLFGEVNTIIYSPNITQPQVKHLYSNAPPPVLNEWTSVYSRLVRDYGEKARVVIYPLASIQIGEW